VAGPRSHRSPAGTSVSVGSLGAGGRPLKQAAEILAADAEAISGRWSRRVPASSQGSPFPRTGKRDHRHRRRCRGAPQAAAFELGLSHPVFGPAPR
jgi:hypothetical protein